MGVKLLGKEPGSGERGTDGKTLVGRERNEYPFPGWIAAPSPQATRM